MLLNHAIYGSVGGLADYRVLGASGNLDERVLTKIAYYSSLGGSALSGPFAPIFAFYPVERDQWAFTRTWYVGPTSRGSDYLVHAIVLDEATLEACDFKPFHLDDANLFASDKPPRDSSLPWLEWDGHAVGSRRGATAPARLGYALRMLARGPLRILAREDKFAASMCRDIQESLPPDDRRVTSFCTRFSYRRALDFRLAAFVEQDEAIVFEQKTEATTVGVGPSTLLGSGDQFDQWVADVRGNPELELSGLSLLENPAQAIAYVRKVRLFRQWAGGKAENFDLGDLRDAAALVLLPKNRKRPAVFPLVAGALAVRLTDLVDDALSARSFDRCAAAVEDIAADLRLASDRWIGEVGVAPLQAWMARVFLLLGAGDLGAITERLTQRDQAHPYLVRLSDRDAGSYRAFLLAALSVLRERFGDAGGRAAGTVAQALVADREALFRFISAMEKTATEGESATRDAWLLAIVRDVVQPLRLSPAIAARILCSHDLLSKATAEELATYAPACLDFTDPLLEILSASQSARVYNALLAGAHQRLRDRQWETRELTVIDVLRRILFGAAEVLRRAPQASTQWDLTAVVFLTATRTPYTLRPAIADAIVAATAALENHGLCAEQAALLRKSLQMVMRDVREGAGILPRTAVGLYRASRKSMPRHWLRSPIWHLRMRTIQNGAKTLLARKAA
jgi:hypothetical protein